VAGNTLAGFGPALGIAGEGKYSDASSSALFDVLASRTVTRLTFLSVCGRPRDRLFRMDGNPVALVVIFVAVFTGFRPCIASIFGCVPGKRKKEEEGSTQKQQGQEEDNPSHA